MATDVVTMKARNREETGSAASRRLRRAGELPGLLAGLGAEPRSIAVGMHEFDQAQEAGARIVSLDLGTEQIEAFIREIQWDPYGAKILHVDFDRVDRTKLLEVDVAIVTFGEAEGVAAGGVLEIYIDTVTVTCLPGSIPEHLEVDVTRLGLGDDIRMRDVPLPEGVTVELDDDEVVMRVVEPEVEEGEEELEGALDEGSAEPEVISRGKEDKEDSD